MGLIINPKTGQPYDTKVRMPARRVDSRRLRGSFDAAQTNAGNRNHWANADSLSADSAASPTVRKTLRERARYEVANNSYARHIINALANDAVGSSVRLQMLGVKERARTNPTRKDRMVSPTPEDAAFVEGEFFEWAQASGLFDNLRTVRAARGTDGETFMIATDNPALETPVKLKYEPFECDLVTGQQLVAQVTDNYLDGIAYDKYGNPVTYDVLKHHPSEGYGAWGDFNRIDARYILHFFNQQRPGLRRGYSELTPALALFAILRRWTLAVVTAAETAADFSLVLETPGEPGELAASQTPFDEIPIVRNMMVTMPEGWSMNQMKAEQPQSTYREVKREVLGEVAAALDIPVHIALQDSSEHNYSSAKLDNQHYVKARKVDRSRLEEQGLDPIFKAWREEAIKIEGYLPQSMRNVNTDWAHKWYWDGDEHVDPIKESSAIKMDLESMATTYAEVYGRKGQDWEEAFEQIAREKAKMDELGISPADTVPVADTPEDQEAIDAAYNIERDINGRVVSVRATRG